MSKSDWDSFYEEYCKVSGITEFKVGSLKKTCFLKTFKVLVEVF